MPDNREIKTAKWSSKKCDVCASAKHTLLSVREYVWPTRDFRSLMKMHDARCESCGFIFEEKIPDEDFLKAYYQSAFSIGSELVDIQPSYDANKRLKFIQRFISSGSHILEVGANRGDFCKFLNDHGFKAAGVDPLEARDAEFVESGFVSNQSKAKTQYDAVVSYYVMEHVVHAREWLDQLSQALKPQGMLIIEVPDFERYPAISLNHEHFLHFTPYHLKKLLSSEGYSVLDVDTETPSRYFGFALAAKKTSRSAVPGARETAEIAPDTAAIYRKALKQKEAEEKSQAEIADEAISWVKKNGKEKVNICFWGANEIATAIAMSFNRKSEAEPLILDNSSQKKGLPHEGFAKPVMSPSKEALSKSANVFILCSPSWNDQIRSQIEGMGLKNTLILDVRDKGIGKAL